LFVANLLGNNVTVYAPGSGNVLRTVSQGVDRPNALAFGGNSDLFVANSNNTVTVYGTGGTKLLRTITQGLNVPDALVFGP
ncbi:MAG: hypothetical protein WCD38_08360, partial [Candidatus Tumulicola sp.]